LKRVFRVWSHIANVVDVAWHRLLEYLTAEIVSSLEREIVTYPEDPSAKIRA
jgi:hypothetical protein